MSTQFDRGAKLFQQGLKDMLATSYGEALAIVTGTFVGLTLEVMRRHGHDNTKEIHIDGGESRDVTIHAKKEPQ